MQILSALQFVQGAVAKKDFVPALTHYNIEGGRVTGFNGRLALSSPIDCILSAKPSAIPLIKAIKTCEEKTDLYMTKSNRLAVKSGAFLAYIDCTEDIFPDFRQEQAKKFHKLPKTFIQQLRLLLPFVSDDASKPWANGVFFAGGAAYATNNIVLLRARMTRKMQVFNLPGYAVKELVRVKDTPESYSLTEHNVTFHYDDGRWLQSSLLATNWPDSIPELLADHAHYNHTAIDSSFFDALEKLLPFADPLSRVFLRNGTLSTHEDLELGASYSIGAKADNVCMNIKQLIALRSIADTFDFQQYPKPCPFRSAHINGVIIGQRQ